MKIVEQYLHEVGRRIPAKGREEVVNELRSLLLDELEQKHGPAADEAAAKLILADFGSPAEVAQRYSGRSHVIAGGLSDLYFLIMKIILGAMAIAFTVIYIVEVAAGDVEPSGVLLRTLRVPLQIFSAWLSGVGGLTLVFIGITRLGWNEGLDPNADWTPDELKDVKIDPETESRFSHIFSIAASMIAIAVLNIHPEIFTVLEEAFLRSTLSLGHRLNIDLFRSYVIPMTILLAFGIVYHATCLRVDEQQPWVRLARTGMVLASLVLTALIVTDMRLYLDYTGMIGFRLIFVIALVGGVIELITEVVKYVKAKMKTAARA